MRRTAVIALLATLLSLLLVPFASPASAADSGAEAEFLSLINQERTSRGLNALAHRPDVVPVARNWTAKLIADQALSHNPSLASLMPSDWISIGENVGFGSTVGGLHTAFMNSAGHRANILGDFNRAGVGAARGADGRLWTTVVFIKGPALGSDVAASNSILRLYRAYFLRDADSAGHDYWLARLRNGELSLADISGSFAGSSEFRTRYGSLDIPRFVRLIYLNVLAREPDPSGYTYWANRLSAGTSRGSMMIGFSESPEFRTRTGLA